MSDDAYCRACHHMTTIVDGYRCAWCKSQDVGIQPRLISGIPHMGPMQEEERKPTKHQRLKEGFSLINGAYSGRSE